jgi:ParB/RepB/Spo0J family partition protein
MPYRTLKLMKKTDRSAPTSTHEATPEVLPWKLANLRPHPEQGKIFGDLPEHKFQELVENLRKEGLKVPIEVTPDGVIICGNNRVRAAEQLGWKEIQAVVRHDLKDLGEAAITTRLIEDNLTRRQLSRLAQARAYQRLKEVSCQLPKNGLNGSEKSEVRDQIGEVLGMSGRNLDRYLAVLSTPRAVQDAFEEQRLALVLAAKVSTFKKPVQEAIAREVADPEANAREVVNRYEKKQPQTPRTIRQSYDRFLRLLEEALEVAPEEPDQVPRASFGARKRLDTLRSVRAVARQFVEIEKETIRQDAEIETVA